MDPPRVRNTWRCTGFGAFVCGVVFVLSLQCGQVSSVDNTTKPLRIVTILEPPFVMRDETTGKFTGLMIDVLQEAGIQIDHIDTPLHDTYGWEDSPGQFNGMIGDLIDKKYDLAVAPFSIRSNRAKFVTFTQPVIHHGYMVLYKLPKEDKWHYTATDVIGTLLKPFSPGLWCLIILTSLLASTSLYVIRRFSPFEDDVTTTSQQRADNSLGTISWGNSLMYLLGSLSGRNVSVSPRCPSGRILTAVWWFFSLMTVGAYIAGLVVVLFKINPDLRKMPFASVDEMISQTDVKVLGVKDSATFNYMAGHKGFFERKIYEYWKHNWDTVMVDSFGEALKMLEEGDGKYAVFMSEDLADRLASEPPCNKMVIGEPVGDLTLGYACQKGSPVCDQMNHAILGLQEAGKMEQLREKYFWSGCHMSSEIYYEGSVFFDAFGGKEPGLLSMDSITIRRFAAAFIVLLIGFIVAMLCLLAEIVYARRKGNIHRQLKNFSTREDANKIQDHDFYEDRDA